MKLLKFDQFINESKVNVDKTTKEFPLEIKDSNGNQIYYEKSDGYWHRREFDSKGNEIYYEDSDGYWNKYEYDSKGNLIYYEDSDGYWHKREYDSNGKEIYFERSDGYWIKREFDSNGNQIYYEDSDGYWSKSEFDSEGNKIYYENSNGKIIDKRPKTELKINEAKIKNRSIIAKLDRIYELNQRLKELTAEVKEINDELSKFDADIKPIFDSMKELNDRLAITKKYVLKITRYGGQYEKPSYAKAIEQALDMVDEAAQAIIKECIKANTKVSNAKHSFEIERLSEAKLTDKVKAVLTKLSTKISGIVDKFKRFFSKELDKIDSANAKLEALLK